MKDRWTCVTNYHYTYHLLPKAKEETKQEQISGQVKSSTKNIITIHLLASGNMPIYDTNKKRKKMEGNLFFLENLHRLPKVLHAENPKFFMHSCEKYWIGSVMQLLIAVFSVCTFFSKLQHAKRSLDISRRDRDILSFFEHSRNTWVESYRAIFHNFW